MDKYCPGHGRENCPDYHGVQLPHPGYFVKSDRRLVFCRLCDRMIAVKRTRFRGALLFLVCGHRRRSPRLYAFVRKLRLIGGRLTALIG